MANAHHGRFVLAELRRQADRGFIDATGPLEHIRKDYTRFSIHTTRARRDDRIGGVALFVISGVSAAGKSTVARLLAERFERGVCVPGDVIRAMIVSGRVDMRPDAGEEALRQLAQRYAGALSVAEVRAKCG